MSITIKDLPYIEHAEMDEDHDEETCPACSAINAESFQGLINDMDRTISGFLQVATKDEKQELSKLHVFLIVKVFLDNMTEGLEIPTGELIKLILSGLDVETQEVTSDQLTAIEEAGKKETIH